MAHPLKLFFCSSPEDRAMLESLKRHLLPLQKQGQIVLWSATDLQAGVVWEQEFSRYLEGADIIVLLISPDFMNSAYWYGTVMKRAMERQDQGNVRVIPILLSPSLWQNAPFAKLQMLPMNGTPITGWPDRDAAFDAIARHIAQIVIGTPAQHVHTEDTILQPGSGAVSLPTPGGSAETESAQMHSSGPGKPPVSGMSSREHTRWDQPATSNQGAIEIHAPVTGGVVGIGHGGMLSVHYGSQQALSSLDRIALKAALQELFTALGNAGLPLQTQIETQTTIGLAIQQIETSTLTIEAFVPYLQRAGHTLSATGISLDQGSHLARSVSKLAHLVGPAVGGVRVVTGWFGIPLP